MSNVPIPPVPDLARIEGTTVDAAVIWLRDYYDREIVPWNYRVGTKCVKQGYRGLHNLQQLVSGCDREKISQSRKSNREIVTLAAPLSFDRKTQVFDLPRRQFPFGRDLYAGYRIPFFFVEERTVKLYFLQPRKDANPTYDQLCMIATIHKRFLLDTEFYGQKSDIEYVDLSAEPLTGSRVVQRYTMADLEFWSEQRLADRLTLISEALEKIRSGDLIKPRRRPYRRPDPEMPLFD